MPKADKAHSTRTPRRPRAAALGASRRRQRPLTRAQMRARLEAAIAAALALLDAMDGDPDAESDFDGEEAHEGCCDAADDDLSSRPCRLPNNAWSIGELEDTEAEPDEAGAQPVTLAPDRAPAKVIAFPRRLRTVLVTA